MSLPNLPYRQSSLRTVVRDSFGGLNHNPAAGDGELYAMHNLSAGDFPLLSVRRPRGLAGTLAEPVDLGAGERPFWVDGTSFFYDGAPRGTVTAGRKAFALLGGRILIFPDKKMYDIAAGTFGSMEAARAGTARFSGGSYAGAPAEANTLTIPSAAWETDFRTGDAVTISGCVTHPENNRTLIVRELDGDCLRFDEYALTLDARWVYTADGKGLAAGSYTFTPEETAFAFTLSGSLREGDRLIWDGSTLTAVIGGVSSAVPVTAGSEGTVLTFGRESVDYTEAGIVSVTREVPALEHVCVNENRLWGCAGDVIYASRLGDPLNFHVFDGLSTDSWQSGTVDAGDFTACVSYLGYPVFFKEDRVYKVYGDRPENFQWTASARLGVQPGSEKSLAVAGETLFYLSRAGICAYTGGIPAVISAPLGANTAWSGAVGGSDGLRYYVSMTDGETHSLFVYDTRYRVWHREDASRALAFAFWDGGLYMLLGSGELWRLDGREGTPEGAVSWAAEFADSTRRYETSEAGSQNKKGLLRLLLRCELEEGSTLTVSLRYDGGPWQEARTVTVPEKQSFPVPLILRRCDRWRLKLSGTGGARVYSIAEEKYGGSWRQAK